MPISMIETADSKVLEVHLSGNLTRDDFMKFAPVAERMISTGRKIGMVVVMDDFQGVEAGAAWEDLKWDAKHYNDVERVAMVGETKWQKTMSECAKPFSGAEVKYFDAPDINMARHWVEEGATTLA